MNYEFLKDKMDSFFAKTSPEEIIRQLEEFGYEFEECVSEVELGMEHVNILHSMGNSFSPTLAGRGRSDRYNIDDSANTCSLALAA